MENAKNFNVGFIKGYHKGLREGREKAQADARACIEAMRQANEAGCISDIEDIVEIVKVQFDILD